MEGLGIIGIGLAAGKGERAYPFSRGKGEYIRSKAVIPFLGRPTVHWLLDEFGYQGVMEYVFSVDKVNHEQISASICHGESFGLRVQYTRPEHDRLGGGSGNVLLRTIEHFGIDNDALVFPIDSIYDIVLGDMYDFHRETGSDITIAGFDCPAPKLINRYGMILWGKDYEVTGFAEKPGSPEDVASHYPGFGPEDISNLTAVASAGCYMVNGRRLRELSDPEGAKDIAGDLIPEVMSNDGKVSVFRIPAYGDLGTPHDYHDATQRCLAGSFGSIDRVGFGVAYDPERRIYIGESSLDMKDREGRTLESKIRDGDVILGSNIRIGEFVDIDPGVSIDSSSISSDSTIKRGSYVTRSDLHDRCFLGEGCRLTDSVVGGNSRLLSEADDPIELDHYVFLGEGVQLGKGCRITDNSLIGPGVSLEPGTIVERDRK